MHLPWVGDDIFLTLLVVVVLIALASFISVFVYGRFAKRARGAPSVSIPIGGPETPVDMAVAPLTQARPGETGVMVLSGNRDAFAARALSGRAAMRSLDMMYYLWRGDMTGGLLLAEVLAAADRGVRVRLLIDDINTRGLDPEYLALTGHRNIEVRLFNPAKNRVASLRRGVEMLLRLFTVTRRMHNKAWIVDGRIAIVGGRNIGDTYFDAAADFNSHDMDALLIGPAVAEVEAIFDMFWNSALVLPIRSLWKDRASDLVGFRRNLAVAGGREARLYLAKGWQDGELPAFLARGPVMCWTATARVLSDPPEKTQRAEKERWLITVLAPLLAGAEREARITTAYFVPGGDGVEGLCRIAGRGVAVSVLTNSLASTNQVTVHGGYAQARPRLLKCGVRLFELRPRDPEHAKTVLRGIDRVSLHTKNFSIDGRIGFIGSFNFDLRSAYLNTEMGLLFDEPALVAAIASVYEEQTSERKSYEAVLRDGEIGWRDHGGRVLEQEPRAGWMRRLIAEIVRHLPIKSQL